MLYDNDTLSTRSTLEQVKSAWDLWKLRIALSSSFYQKSLEKEKALSIKRAKERVDRLDNDLTWLLRGGTVDGLKLFTESNATQARASQLLLFGEKSNKDRLELKTGFDFKQVRPEVSAFRQRILNEVSGHPDISRYHANEQEFHELDPMPDYYY